jgi:hypothetical protein
MRKFILVSTILFLGCGPSNTYVTNEYQPVDGGEELMISGRQSQPNTMTTGITNPVNGLQVSLVNPQGQPESGTMTLQFQVQPPVSATNGINGVFACQALISWTISGNRVTRRISVGNGRTITGVGEAVTVQLIDHTADIFGVGSPSLGLGYGVDVQVGIGPRGSTAQLPTLTEANSFVVLDGTTPTESLKIPQDAGAIAVQVLVSAEAGLATPTDDFSVSAIFNNGAGNIGAFDPLNDKGMIPIPAGANNLSITNNTTGPTIPLRITVIWGIDG